MKPIEALRALGTGGEAPADAKLRVQAALFASIAASAAATGATAAAQSAAVSTAPTAAAGSLAGLTSAKALALASSIWLIGGATGAALYSALHREEVRVVYVDRPVLADGITAPSSVILPVMSTPAPVSSASAAPPADSRTSKRTTPSVVIQGSDLARERALLDLARSAASQGEPARVLEQTERHRAQFARGKLAEEREALAIRALLSLGRTSEARTRAEAFHLAYPNSLLAPAIDSALSAQ
jgi:hypothetical protein